MGLVARPNQLPKEKVDHEETEATKTSPTKSHVIELFDVPDSDRPSRRTRFPLTEEEEIYIARCMTKHGDNYTAMFRDIKTNNMQHTEHNLRKMGSRFLLLTAEQRRVPVPAKVQALLPTNGDDSSEEE